MARARPAAQIERLVQGLRSAGIDVLDDYEPAARPTFLNLVSRAGRRRVRAFCWNITPGGAHRPPNERRVQATRSGDAPLHLPGGPPTLLLGYEPTLDVFAAWDETKHRDPSSSPSLQIPLEVLEEAAREGIAGHEREVEEGLELVVAFRPENVGTYLQIADLLDVLEDEDLAVTAAAATGDVPAEAELPESAERRRAVLTVSRAVRDARFRTRVVRAHQGRCAFCGLNVTLAQAAHVRPVHAGGSDAVTNGIAACPTHHAAFDRGFLLINDDYTVAVNEERLRAAGATDEDLQALSSAIYATLRLPHDPGDRPSPQNLAAHRAMWA